MMKLSIKSCITFLVMSVVVIVFIATIILSRNVIDIDNIFSINNIIVLIILLFIFLIPTLILSRMITFPLKKIDKVMKTVATGKIAEAKHLRDTVKLLELQDTIENFSLMMEVIKKNNFDYLSQNYSSMQYPPTLHHLHFELSKDQP